MNSVWLPILVFGVLLLIAASLAWLAFRRKGLIPLDACSCGYSAVGNESGTCPECGKFINEELERARWQRGASLLKRAALWAAAVAIIAVPATAGVLRLVGERRVVDCRTFMIPKDGSFQSVEMTWKVRQEPAAGVGPVRVEIRSGGGIPTIKEFYGPEGVDEWMSAASVGASLGAKAELVAAIKAASAGAQLILAGGSGSAFTLIANGSVATVESRRWVAGSSIVVWVLVLLVGLRAVFRRVMGRV